MGKSVHRRHRAGRRFQPNPYDPEKARQAIRDAISEAERECPRCEAVTEHWIDGKLIGCQECELVRTRG